VKIIQYSQGKGFTATSLSGGHYEISLASLTISGPGYIEISPWYKYGYG